MKRTRTLDIEQSTEIPKNDIKKKIFTTTLSQCDTDEEIIPLQYQGKWKIAGGKYTMVQTELKQMKQILKNESQQKASIYAIVPYKPLTHNFVNISTFQTQTNRQNHQEIDTQDDHKGKLQSRHCRSLSQLIHSQEEPMDLE